MGHAAAAYFLGDRSVRYFGHFSIDPRRFLEPVGVLTIFLALVGWGRRVPIQSNRISSTGQKVLYELGGPAANLTMLTVEEPTWWACPFGGCCRAASTSLSPR